MAERAWVETGLREAALAGDACAWRRLVTDHVEPLRRYLAWRLGGLHDVDDLAQEVWLQAAKSLRRFDPLRGPFHAWLMGIAFHTLRNHRRSVRRSKQRPMPEGELAASEEDRQAERVAEALEQLPENYEQVLRAKYLEGRSVACIAQSTGQGEKAVESLLTRARQAFRTSYERETS